MTQPAAAAPAPATPALEPAAASTGPAPDGPPLQGITIADFSMGWAGPLASFQSEPLSR